MENKSESALAEKIRAVLAWLKKKRTIRFENEVVKKLGITPQTLTFAKGVGNHLRRERYEDVPWTRQSLFDAILNEYDLEEFEDGFRFRNPPPVTVSSDAVVQQSDLDAEVEAVHYFVYYSRDSQKNSPPLVKKGKLVISQYRDHRERAVLTLKDSKGNPLVYEGRKMNAEQSTAVYFWLEQKKGSKSHSSRFSSLILNTSQDHYESVLTYGVFSASGPSCGKVVLEKCDSEDILNKALKNDHVDPWIASLLVLQRIEAKDSPLLDWEELDSFSYAEKLNSVTGVFYLYSIDQKHWGFSRNILEITNDGSALLKWQLTKDEYSGLAIVSKDRTILRLYFDFNKELGDYQIRFLLKLDNNLSHGLFGVFSGMDRNHNDPMGGKCFLQKRSEAYHDLAPSLIREYKELRETEGLVKFFQGNDDLHPFGDAPALTDEILGKSIAGDIPNRNGDPFNHQERIAELAGVYRILFLSTNMKNVISCMVDIRPNGEFEMKEYKDPSEFSSGKISVFKNILIFTFDQRGGREHRGEMFFHVGELKRNDFKYLQGVSILITRNLDIRAGKTLLYICDEPFDSATSYAVPIPYNGQNREEFDRLDKEFGNVGRFLMGDTNNLVLPERYPDVELKSKEDFKKIHFTAACYYGHKHDLGGPERRIMLEKVKAHIKRAVDHGFGLDKEDVEDLNKERLTGGLLSSIPEQDWKKIQLKKLKLE